MDKLQQSDAERIEEQQEQQPAPMMMGMCCVRVRACMRLCVCVCVHACMSCFWTLCVSVCLSQVFVFIEIFLYLQSPN